MFRALGRKHFAAVIALKPDRGSKPATLPLDAC
jgi:hypothetical protein